MNVIEQNILLPLFLASSEKHVWAEKIKESTVLFKSH